MKRDYWAEMAIRLADALEDADAGADGYDLDDEDEGDAFAAMSTTSVLEQLVAKINAAYPGAGLQAVAVDPDREANRMQRLANFAYELANRRGLDLDGLRNRAHRGDREAADTVLSIMHDAAQRLDAAQRGR